jgi:hypothetical protein
MATIPVDRELRAHEESYVVFRRIVFYAIMHIAFTIVCLALAFLGDASAFAALLWIGGTLAMLSLYIARTSHG